MNKIRDILLEIEPNIMFLEPKFDKALIGSGRACGANIVAAYNSDECLKILINEFHMADFDALEQFQDTVDNVDPGPYRPIFINDFRKIKDLGDLDVNLDDTMEDFHPDSGS